jgi:hypothetical protein
MNDNVDLAGSVLAESTRLAAIAVAELSAVYLINGYTNDTLYKFKAVSLDVHWQYAELPESKVTVADKENILPIFTTLDAGVVNEITGLEGSINNTVTDASALRLRLSSVIDNVKTDVDETMELDSALSNDTTASQMLYAFKSKPQFDEIVGSDW